MDNSTQDFIGTAVSFKNGMVQLDLADGSAHAFPVQYYPRLCNAASSDLAQVCLRVGGRALRWEALDEDIWVADAVCQKYPKQSVPAVAEPQAPYGK
ncbi:MULTISPECIES: DUF2442 domain-containing protein [unclassified Lentimonas]|uniref:DUF2442 domain-containing protein n=1 Tax=unclassified Lentimonas TaxID=2630993 RepID=UPI0013225D83|nr:MULTISPECIES: DUF2442 domain-containing protein [unclassified Lentimonas]CAA6680049.1 Unannotated [Lentimonas sp. CC4]CAA6685169.1 Unannotated [Lentimonas sp. CC6]CAA7075105.1 Unannotated [Lentimonas sp. CC4]CAA7168435.1 Unannotated [Lentimonas sp. CC21]CAA7182130.1 Unannotated [Lentimonas sp. CC8]